MSVCNCHGMIFLDCPNYRKAMNRAPMTEAKGSDVRAAYVDTGTPKCPVCQMPMNGSVECHLPSCTLRVLQEADVEARAQAAAVEMRERCASKLREAASLILVGKIMPSCENPLLVSEGLKVLADILHSFSIPTSTLDAALLRARIEELKEIRKCGFLGTYSDETAVDCRIADLERQLAALTQPAPEKAR